MVTCYQQRVDAAQRHVLDALSQHTQPEAASLALLRSAVPSALGEEAPDGSGQAFRSLPPADRELLAAALYAAAAELVAGARRAVTPIMAYRLAPDAPYAVAALVDAALWLASRGPAPVEAGLPALLLEQIVETVTNEECEGLFAYLDSRIAAFHAEPVFARSHLTLLRTCNLLLKRLSKSANSLLCGRILLFLAKFLPLTERSGVNLMGHYNTDNTTTVEDVQEGALDSEGKPVDVDLYKTFWGLQAWFSDPPAVLAPGKWLEVSRGVRKVLDKLRAVPVAITEAAPGAGQLGSVKYLSSPRLLTLQLRDATFRRHFLLQCLILMQFLERPRQKEKDIRERQGLRGKVLEDLQELRSQVYAALESTPERGREFAAAVRQVIRWEDSWAAWKQGGCPRDPFERRPVAPPKAAKPGAPAEAGLPPPPKKRKLSSDATFGVRVGTDELDRLWNLTEDNLSCLSADDRGGFKTLKQLMYPVIEQMHDEVDDAMKASKSEVYSWKTLRMVARQSLQVFSKAVRAGGDLEVAARDLYPDECPPPPERPAAAPSATTNGAAAANGTAAAAAAADASTGAAPTVVGKTAAVAGGAGTGGSVDAGAHGDDDVAAAAAAPETGDDDAAGAAAAGDDGGEVAAAAAEGGGDPGHEESEEGGVGDDDGDEEGELPRAAAAAEEGELAAEELEEGEAVAAEVEAAEAAAAAAQDGQRKAAALTGAGNGAEAMDEDAPAAE